MNSEKQIRELKEQLQEAYDAMAEISLDRSRLRDRIIDLTIYFKKENWPVAVVTRVANLLKDK